MPLSTHSFILLKKVDCTCNQFNLQFYLMGVGAACRLLAYRIENSTFSYKERFVNTISDKAGDAVDFNNT